MGIFSEVVADSRPRFAPRVPAAPETPEMTAPASDEKSPEPEVPSVTESSIMVLGVEERTGDVASATGQVTLNRSNVPEPVSRQGEGPSSTHKPAAAVSRTAKEVVSDVLRLSGERNPEQGTTGVYGIVHSGNEARGVLGERSRLEGTETRSYVDLDAHASVPSPLGRSAAVKNGSSFERGSELSENVESGSLISERSSGSYGELENVTGALAGSQKPGPTPPPPHYSSPVAAAPAPARALTPDPTGLRPAPRTPGPPGEGGVTSPTSSPPISLPSNRRGGQGEAETNGEKAGRSTLPSPGGPGVREAGQRPVRPGVRAESPRSSQEPMDQPAGPAPAQSAEEAAAPASVRSAVVAAAGREAMASMPPISPVVPSPIAVPVSRRPAPARQQPAAPRVQIGRIEVIVTAPAPPARPAPSSAPTSKPGALASRRYLKSL